MTNRTPRLRACFLMLALASVPGCSPTVSAGAAAAPHAAPDAARPRVLVLGTFHIGGSGDYIQTRTDDVLAPHRQAEIAALVESLAAFRPTRIMVEAPLARDSALNARYRGVLSGRDTLTRNEIDQIGFRLARRMGHERVYAIDYPQNEDVGSVVGWAAGHGDTAFVGMFQRFAAGKQAQSDSLSHLTIPEYLRRLNHPAEDSTGHAAYLRMARVGDETTHVGADVLAGRYARNLKIYANLARLAGPGDRVLVIYGSSHGKLLREFVRQSGDMELVDVDPYLRIP